MSDLFKGFTFDLQRFATFKGSTVFEGKEDMEEQGITLSQLFNSSGKAWLIGDIDAKTFDDDTNFFWEKSGSVINLTPEANNADLGEKITLVSGTYSNNVLDLKAKGEKGYVIQSVTAIDASGLEEGDVATFSSIGNTKILNPNGTIAIGNNTVTFNGQGAKEEDAKTYGTTDNPWNVGTIVNVSNNKITTVDAAAGESITTADGTGIDFTNGGTATFDGKSFDTVTAYANEGTAGLNISADAGDNETPIVLTIEDVETTAKNGSKAITVDLDGQAVKSVDFTSTTKANVSFLGTKVIGNDISIQKGTLNVANISSADSTQAAVYHYGAKGGDILDLSNTEVIENKTLTVSKTGNASYVVVKDNNEAGADSVSIGGTKYTFEDVDSDGKGGVFVVEGDKVTGFVFRDVGDAITVPKGSNLKLYTTDSYKNNSITNLQEIGAKGLSIASALSSYTVTKTANGYSLDVSTGTVLGLGSATLSFTLPKNKTTGFATLARITFSNDGLLESISQVTDNEEDDNDTPAFNVGGVKIDFSGVTDEFLTDDFTVGGVGFGVESGNFDYSVGGKNGTVSEDNDVSLNLKENTDTITKMTSSEGAGTVNINFAEGEGTVTIIDENGESREVEYNSEEGNAGIELSETGEQAYVLRDVGDFMPLDGTSIKYLNRAASDDEDAIVEISMLPSFDNEDDTEGDTKHTIRMSKATTKRSNIAEFVIGNSEKENDEVIEHGIAAGATLHFDDADFTFSDEGGLFEISQKGTEPAVAKGFYAESGTVTMNEAAAALLAKKEDEEDDVNAFQIDYKDVNITANGITDEGLVYNKDEKSLLGLGNGSEIVDAGDITKIYAPETRGTFTFGTGDTAKTFRSEASSEDEENRAYFTVNGQTVEGFTFIVLDDEIAGEDFSDLKLYSGKDDTTGFAAPVITDLNEEPASVHILRTLDDNNVECYAIEADTDNNDSLSEKVVTFPGEETTKLTFTQANTNTEIFFDLQGNLLSIGNLSTDGNTLTVENAQAAIQIDDATIDIENGGFTYQVQEDGSPSITDVLPETKIIEVHGIDQIVTAGGSTANGTYTFGTDKEFTLDGSDDGITFNIDPDAQDVTVVGISGVSTGESVTGALNNLLLNGTTSVAIDGGDDNIYTFSGTSFAGLKDGDKVVSASGINDFITGEEGEFSIFGTSVGIAGDSAVTFSITDDKVDAITGLEGSALGSFSGITVNGQSIGIIETASERLGGDGKIEVFGNSTADDVVKVGALNGIVEVVDAGGVSQLVSDGTIMIRHEGGRLHAMGDSSITFGLSGNVVTSVDKFGDGVAATVEGVLSGLTINGELIDVVGDGGSRGAGGDEKIVYKTDGDGNATLVGIDDGGNGVEINAIGGASVVQTYGDGKFTFFGDQHFEIAGQSAGQVNYTIEDGKVVGITGLSDTATITGSLNGITINESADGPIQVVENDDLSYSNGTITGVSDTNTVQSADGATFVKTDGSGTFKFGDDEFTIVGDSDGVTFEVTDKNKVVGISGLDDNATLTGALSGLSSVNGMSFQVNNDPDFGIVGGTSGLKEIFDLSDNAEVVNAGGASIAKTDTEGTFTFAGESFKVAGDSAVEFALDTEGKVEGIADLDGTITSNAFNGKDIAVNGQSFAINGDEGDLAIVGNGTGIETIANVGGASGVTVANAGDATAIITDKAGALTVGDKTFTTAGDDTVKFALANGEVSAIEQLSGSVELALENETVNGKAPKITGDEGTLKIYGNATEDGITKIENVGGASGVIVTSADGAEEIQTDKAGEFTIGGKTFTTAGDDTVTFALDNEVVAGISNIDAPATVSGDLDQVALNGESVAITGDDDVTFTFASGGKTLTDVAGDVAFEAIGGASKVIAGESGTYTFGTKAYDVNDADGVTFNVDGLNVTSIEGLSGDVTGDFTADGFKVNNAALQIAGDNDIKVVAEGGSATRIENFSDKATIVAAEGPSVAITDGDGTFVDVDGTTISLEGDPEATFGLDGHGKFNSVDVNDDATVKGDIGDIDIGGHSVLVISRSGSGTIRNPYLTFENGKIGGLSDQDTIVSADNAATLSTTEDGTFTFGTVSGAQVFTVTGDSAVDFIVDRGTTDVVGINELAGTVEGALGGLSINGGEEISIRGDADNLFSFAGDTEVLGKVGGEAVTIYNAGGADSIETETTGTFKFNQSGQKFTVTGDSSVVFGITDEESVTTIDSLNGAVTGDFRNQIAVNGEAVQVAGDKTGVTVSAVDDGVTRIDGVDAGSTVQSWGSAAQASGDGEGKFTFVGADNAEQKFTVAATDNTVEFNLDRNNVIGVEDITNGTVTFDTATTALEVNPGVNDLMTFGTSAAVTLTVESRKVVGIEGDSLHAVTGVETATISATDSITVNGTEVGISDADDKFNVEVTDFEVTKVTGVTGNAIINVEDLTVETDKDGIFVIDNERYTVTGDNNVAFTTDEDGDLAAVDSLEGTLVIADGNEELSVNGNYVEVVNSGGDTVPVSITSDGASITAVNGLNNYDSIAGDLDNASIAIDAPDSLGNYSVLDVNDTRYVLMPTDNATLYAADADGVTVNGAGAVTGLDEDSRMLVVDKGTYTVNGAVLNANAGDTIIGGYNTAYLYDPNEALIRKNTPLSAIESLTGVPEVVDDPALGSEGNPIDQASLASVAADETFDWNRPLALYTTNLTDSVQAIDLSGAKFTKKAHLYKGDQDVIFNDAGGNLAHVESVASGAKNITLGNATLGGGGDVVVVDETAGIGNSVSILGGAGNDSIFVRDSAETTFNMSAGGEDKIVTFSKSNARIKLENYEATTGAGIQFEQHEVDDVAKAIDNGVVSFGDGVVSLKTSGDNVVQVSLVGHTDSVGGSIVNLFTPEGKKQAVGFSNSAGGSVPGSNMTDDMILIGNKGGKKTGTGVLLGGIGNDTVFAGERDIVDAGAGNNAIILDNDSTRGGAQIAITEGNNTIYGANNTLDSLHGDTLAIDLSQFDLEYDGETSNLIVKSKAGSSLSAYATIVAADKDGTLAYAQPQSAAATTAADTTAADTTAASSDLASSADVAESADADEPDDSVDTTPAEPVEVPSLIADHNYTNQIINSNGDVVRAAIGAKGSVIDVKLDEDVRANYYKGDDSGLTFGGTDGNAAYNGEVSIDLGGDWLTDGSSIDGAVTVFEGINKVQAGSGTNMIKGSGENETLIAGRGNTYLYGDGGKNLMVGYTGADGDKEGQTTFYVLGHAGDGVNTVRAFEFISDDNYTNDIRITADKLDFDLNTNVVSRVALSGDNVVVEVTNKDGSATESVILEGAKNKDVLVGVDGVLDSDVIAKVGDDTLEFDKFANYYNASGKNATLNVATDQVDSAQIWLDGSKGIDYQGDIHVINASLFGGTAELAGNDYDNVIYAGSGDASLWGGNHGDDSLYGGSGKDTFYYTLGNGTDTIYGAKDGDVVNLAGVTLDELDIDNFAYSEIGVKLAFKDGGVLYIGDDGKNNVSYVVQGETYYVNEEHNGFVKKQ